MPFHTVVDDLIKVCIAPDSLSLQVLYGRPTMASDNALGHGGRFV